MFKLDTSDSYKWPIKFTSITANGETADNQFIAIFKRIPCDEAIEMSKPTGAGAMVTVDDLLGLRDMAAEGQTDDLVDEINALIDSLKAVKSGKEVVDADLDAILRFMTGWEGVDINGDTSFSRDNLRLLLNGVPNIALRIFEDFYVSVMGGRQQKNLKKPRAAGR